MSSTATSAPTATTVEGSAPPVQHNKVPKPRNRRRGGGLHTPSTSEGVTEPNNMNNMDRPNQTASEPHRGRGGYRGRGGQRNHAGNTGDPLNDTAQATSKPAESTANTEPKSKATRGKNQRSTTVDQTTNPVHSVPRDDGIRGRGGGGGGMMSGRGQNRRGGRGQNTFFGPPPAHFVPMPPPSLTGTGNPAHPLGTFPMNPNAVPFVPQQQQSRNAFRPNNQNNRRQERGSAQSRGSSDVRVQRNTPKFVRRPQRQEDYNDKSLRERLTRQLEDNAYECMICCQIIGARQGIWTCSKCYHMFHIAGGCITEWARKSSEEDGMWRCPACNDTYDKIPYNYMCFCGKERNPVANKSDVPHTCGSICGRNRGIGCVHKCTDPCHPGPCPECPVQLIKRCECGKVEKAVRCGTGVEVKCETICEMTLNCGVHSCSTVCHSGQCEPCDKEVEQSCHCGSSTRQVICGSPEQSTPFGCGKECDGMYSCGKHKCIGKCHPLFSSDHPCGPCPNSPERIGHCPCGKETVLSLLEGKQRESCEDPVPTCENTCDKILLCGPPGNLHRCRQQCHTGPCNPCKLNSTLICECGNLKSCIPCVEYAQYADGGTRFRCQRRCRKMKSCGVHKCGNNCCTEQEHICMQICGRQLSCGEHRCERLCHNGQCGRCLNASFDEQFCLCGRTMRDPPIPCGSPLPECHHPCAREHPCDHAVNHNCHSDDRCPPCTVLTSKWCFGGHELRSNIPCHLNQISCGIACDRPLRCGAHNCDRRCHRGDCEKEEEKCTRPCRSPRVGCDHPCSIPCHGTADCPPSDCKAPVDVTCECGRKQETIKCIEVSRHVSRLRAIRAEEEAERADSGNGGVRILRRSASMDRLRSLPCDSECSKLARNRAMADALHISTDENGDANSAPTITYPDYLRHVMRTQPTFLKDVERIFSELIKRADETIQSMVASHHFKPMKLEVRRAVHEYAEYFQIGTESVDQGSQRSVVATAKKGVSRPPLVLLSAFAARFPHAMNVPGPVTLNSEKLDAILNPKPAPTTTEPVLKAVGTTSVKSVHRRVPIVMEKAKPLPVKNPFAALEDVDSEELEESVRRSKRSSPAPQRDPFDDDEVPPVVGTAHPSSQEVPLDVSQMEWADLMEMEKEELPPGFGTVPESVSDDPEPCEVPEDWESEVSDEEEGKVMERHSQ